MADKRMCEEHGQDIHELMEKCSRWSKILDGNGRPSLEVRLDRIERIISVAQWLIGVVVIETIALTANIVLLLIK
jgi:hypothetical protein